MDLFSLKWVWRLEASFTLPADTFCSFQVHSSHRPSLAPPFDQTAEVRKWLTWSWSLWIQPVFPSGSVFFPSPTPTSCSEMKALVQSHLTQEGLGEMTPPSAHPAPGFSILASVLSLMHKMWTCGESFANILISTGTEASLLESREVLSIVVYPPHIPRLLAQRLRKAAHINSHKLPLQNVKIKSGFLFWGHAWWMLTPSCR